MKIIVRIIALVLAFVMLSSNLVACGADAPKDVIEGGSGDTVATTEAAVKVKSLSDVFWDGEQYRILAHKDDNKGFNDFEIDYEEMPEDVVGLAVWNRNYAVEQKYGLEVSGTLTSSNVHTEAEVFLASGDDQYDLIICMNSSLLALAMEGYLVNINELDYVDFEKDCWNSYANEQFSYGNKLYYTSNKFLLQEKHRTWMVWYNRTLARELNVGYLEDEVFAGSWTLDRLVEIAKSCSANVDGVEGMTSSDRWGFTAADPYTFGVLAYGGGFRISDRGQDGYPKMVGATEHVISVLDKVFELAGDKNTSFFTGCRPTADENAAGKGEQIFKEGRAVVMGNCLSFLDYLSNLEFEYGVLPNPKYNEAQENYYSVPNIKNGHLFAVPTTVNDIEKAGFGLEAISEEAVGTSYKEYIETRCKLQDAYDEDMAKCLTIIFDTIVYDIALLDDIGTFGTIMTSQLVKSGTNTYARLYDKNAKRANTQLDSIREKFSAH